MPRLKPSKYLVKLRIILVKLIQLVVVLISACMPSKSTAVFENVPAIINLSLPSFIIFIPYSVFALPILYALMNFPVGLYLAINISTPPFDVRVFVAALQSRSIVPVKEPIV